MTTCETQTSETTAPPGRRGARRSSEPGWEIEGGKHIGVKRHDIGDRPSFDLDDAQREWPIVAVIRTPQIEGHRGLSVGSGRDHSEVSAELGRARIREPLKERNDRIATLIPNGERRHEQASILCEQRGETLEVPALDRIDIAAH